MRSALRSIDPSVFFARALLAIATLFTLLGMSANASAQQSTFYLDRLDIGNYPEDGFAVWRPRLHERTRFFGQFALGYQLHPLRGATVAPLTSRDPDRTPNPVGHQLTAYMHAGVEIMNRVGFDVGVPVVAYQDGDTPCQRESSCQGTDIDPTVPSDVRLGARLLLFRDNTNRFHLGLAGNIWIPSGNRYSFTSDDRSHGAVRVLAEYDLKPIILAVNTGVHFRPDQSLNRLYIGHELIWAAGAFLPMRDGKVRLGAQLFGSTGLGSSRGQSTSTGANTPVEWLGEIRFALDRERAGWFSAGAGTRLSSGYGAPDLRVLASVGYAFGISDTNPNAPGRRYEWKREKEPTSVDTDKDGIPDELDQCPTVPEDRQPPDDSDGCPAPPDRDHDGIPDESDKCPDQAEDKDGVDDLDGCPEDDFDADGIPDESDACPREPGVKSDDAKKNGCPQFIRRIEGSTEIQILKKVEFATASTAILPNSYPILDEVVNLLKINAEIKKVSVEGHTDSRGARDMNMRLSQGRAESVMRYLIQHGVAAARLSAQGFGPDRPLDTNDTDPGRQRNRRVEFHIVE